MPQKLTGSSFWRKPQPCMFSSYGRSVSRLRELRNSKSGFLETIRIYPEGKVVAREILNDKAESTESSDAEESDKPDDFHGIKMLLQTYLDDKEWDLSGFVDLILGQSSVGTVVKVEDVQDEGIFAVVSALNMGRYKDHKSMKGVKEYLSDVCRNLDISKKIKALINEQAHG